LQMQTALFAIAALRELFALYVASVNGQEAVRKRFLVRATGSRYGGSNTVPCRELAFFQSHKVWLVNSAKRGLL
jgi:hypothetical protein